MSYVDGSERSWQDYDTLMNSQNFFVLYLGNYSNKSLADIALSQIRSMKGTIIEIEDKDKLLAFAGITNANHEATIHFHGYLSRGSENNILRRLMSKVIDRVSDTQSIKVPIPFDPRLNSLHRHFEQFTDDIINDKRSLVTQYTLEFETFRQMIDKTSA